MEHIMENTINKTVQARFDAIINHEKTTLTNHGYKSILSEIDDNNNITYLFAKSDINSTDITTKKIVVFNKNGYTTQVDVIDDINNVKGVSYYIHNDYYDSKLDLYIPMITQDKF